MTKKQRDVLNRMLTEYPYDWTFEQVLKGIKKQSSKITVWEPFELDDPEDLIQKIKDNLGDV